MEEFLYRLESYLKAGISRKTFLKTVLGAILLFISNNTFLKSAFAKVSPSNGRPGKGIKGDYDLVVAKGDDPFNNTVRAVEALGGMGRFVKNEDVVVVKPNMAWDREPLQAANTDPDVVAALVQMAYEAGAKKVKVFDVPCNDESRCHENTGIAKAAKEKGADVFFVNHWNVVKAHFPYASPMEDWSILKDAVDCDVFINAPVLKHHRLTGLTLSMKNLMGVCSGTRGLMHMDIGKKLVDLTDFISPDLTVIDATRVLLRNGPSGGDINDVEKKDTVIVGTDPTLTDVYACTLVEKNPREVPYIKVAEERKFGSLDLSKAKIKKI